MLKVVDAVCERSPRHFVLEHAREQMYRQLQDLVFVARQVFEETSPIPVDERMSVTSLLRVSDCVAQCVRTANECSSASRTILERIGDFELDEPVAIAKPVPNVEAPVTAPSTIEFEEQPKVENDCVPESQEPEQRAESEEPLDVSEFPMPGLAAPALPPLDTGVASLEDAMSLPSASTVVTTPDSQHGSIASTANVLTPCTPMSVQETKVEDVAARRFGHGDEVVGLRRQPPHQAQVGGLVVQRGVRQAQRHEVV